jgi:hypothetical protein
MKKLAQAAVLAVVAMATLALAIPTPVVNACIKCVYRPCPPCTRLGTQTCYRCATCQAIPNCGPY